MVQLQDFIPILGLHGAPYLDNFVYLENPPSHSGASISISFHFIACHSTSSHHFPLSHISIPGDLRMAPRSWLNGAPVAILPAPTRQEPAPAPPDAELAPEAFRFDALAQQLQRLQDARSMGPPWTFHVMKMDRP